MSIIFKICRVSRNLICGKCTIFYVSFSHAIPIHGLYMIYIHLYYISIHSSASSSRYYGCMGVKTRSILLRTDLTPGYTIKNLHIIILYYYNDV